MKTYYQTQMTRSKHGMSRSAAPQRPVAWPAETVWAAAAYAHRINEREYLKHPEYAQPQQHEDGYATQAMTRMRNQDLMRQVLADESVIIDADRDLGCRARDYVTKQILVKALKGTLSEFEQSLQRAVALEDFDEWTSRVELAMVASQIRSYEQAVQLAAAMEGISDEPVAAVGTKVDTEITVVKSVYSQNFGVYFITGVTTDRRAVFFSYRERLANGHQCRIRGTVKAHRENSTQLNRVRIA